MSQSAILSERLLSTGPTPFVMTPNVPFVSGRSIKKVAGLQYEAHVAVFPPTLLTTQHLIATFDEVTDCHTQVA